MLSSIDSISFAPVYPRATAGDAVKAFEPDGGIAPPLFEQKPQKDEPRFDTASTKPPTADTAPKPPALDPSLFDLMRKYFEAGDKRADVDGNGHLNANDFMAFINYYAQGINPFERPTPPATDPAIPAVAAADPVKPKDPLDPSLFDRMRKLFAAGDKRADIDGNGELNIFDFLEFQNLYAAGINPFNQPDPTVAANDPAPVNPATDPLVPVAANDPAPPDLSPFRLMMKLFAAGDKQADINRDGQLTVADFGRFQTLYVMGLNPFLNPAADPELRLLDVIG